MVDKKEIWTTEDGKEFTSKDEALAHEKELKDPKYATEKRFEELERKISDLQAQILKLVNRVERIEYPWGKSNPIKGVVPNSPFDQKVWYGVGQNLTEALNNLKEVNE